MWILAQFVAIFVGMISVVLPICSENLMTIIVTGFPVYLRPTMDVVIIDLKVRPTPLCMCNMQIPVADTGIGGPDAPPPGATKIFMTTCHTII